MLKVLQNACQSEIRLNLKQCLRFPLFHHKDAQSAPKRLPEWNKTKFETNASDFHFFITKMLKVLRNACKSEIRLNLKQCLRFPLCHHKDACKVLRNACLKQWNKTEFETMVKVWRFHWLHLCCFTAIVKWGQTSSHLLKTSSFKLLDSNRQPVYYYNEHGQVEIVVITRKEFFKLTFLSFGIPYANR